MRHKQEILINNYHNKKNYINLNYSLAIGLSNFPFNIKLFLLFFIDLPKEMAIRTFFTTFFFQLLFLESLRDFDIFFFGTAMKLITNNFDTSL